MLSGVVPAGGPEWIDLIGSYGVLEHSDVISLHAFPGTWSARRIGWAYLLMRVNQILRRHSSHRPIWISEASYSTMRRRGRRSLEHEYRQTREGDEAGILRIDFASTESEGLEPISWGQVFDTFERSKLAFLYQEEIGSGQTSRFFKFGRRD